jgi:ABC-type transport system involved in multi-copper enzyme maturation permease subunit
MATPIPTDFSDRISPMLVKELRQGMRAKTFIMVFLALQTFLALILFSAGAASTSDSVGGTISSIIFTFFSIAVLVIQPLRGTNALSSEVKGNTIDMMVLTRLSAWRIVWGKWIAIISQSALLFVTIIPYLILRYFFGGMNLVAEITALFLVFLTSMALTAVTVGLSGCSSVIIRAVVPIIGLLMLLWMLFMGMMMMAFGGGRGSNPFDALSLDTTEARIGVAAYVASVIYLGWNMLSLGASLIAPAAENHSLLRRIISLVLIAIILLAGVFGFVEEEELQLLFAAVIAVPAIFIALTDSSILVRPVVVPFVRRGPIGRLAGWFLYPTWASGVLYAILITAIAMAAFFLPEAFVSSYNPTGTSDFIVLFGLTGGLFFPAVFQSVFFRGEGQRLAQYLLILVSSLIMLGILTMLADAMNNTAFLWAFAWNPLAFIAMLEVYSTDRDMILAGVVVVDIVLITVLLVRTLMEVRLGGTVIQEARNSLDRAE